MKRKIKILSLRDIFHYVEVKKKKKRKVPFSQIPFLQVESWNCVLWERKKVFDQ